MNLKEKAKRMNSRILAILIVTLFAVVTGNYFHYNFISFHVNEKFISFKQVWIRLWIVTENAKSIAWKTTNAPDIVLDGNTSTQKCVYAIPMKANQINLNMFHFFKLM